MKRFSGNSDRERISLKIGIRTPSFSIIKPHRGRKRIEYGELKMKHEDGLRMLKKWSMSFALISQICSPHPDRARTK